ncbi:M10 family metallopeptidase C-terminal domain-containing protein [Rhodobacteraceae bacterium XHP0102]|nr:M10 family metallopeptidase C-terminal domain-containing protein [Rhodobacteraceae bacterium XHP0102]
MRLELAQYLPEAGNPLLSRVTDLSLIDPDGSGPTGPRLYATNRYDGQIWGFDIDADAVSLVTSSAHLRPDAAGAVAEIYALPTQSGPAILTGGGGAHPLARFDLSDQGVLSAGMALPDTPAITSDLGQMTGVDLADGAHLVFGALSQGGGLATLRFSAAGTLENTTIIPLGTISALTQMVTTSGQTLLFVAQDGTSRVEAYALSPQGGVSLLDHIDGQSGLSTAQVMALKAARVAGQDLLIIGGAGSSSLSVVRIGPNGEMDLADHIMDTSLSRFGGLRVVETVQHGAETFVVAAGTDDGLSVFRLLPTGRLVEIATRADGFAESLADISDIAAISRGDHIEIFVTSSSEAGLTKLELVTGDMGDVLFGDQAANTLSGTAFADIIDGGSGSDILSAGAGDDLIRDGAGIDVMNGGAGADIFALSWDQMADYITGYEVGIDRLDLSDWVMLRNPSQLQITETANGVELRYRGEFLSIRSLDDTPISTEAVLADIILGPHRYLPEWTEAILAFDGRPELPVATTLQGGLGNTRFLIDHVDDVILNEIGFSQGGGIDTVETWIDYQLPANIEILRMQGEASLSGRGGFALEALVGNRGANLLDGGGGNDLLNGKDGNDILIGGIGADTLVGEAGADVFRYLSPLDSPAGPTTRDFINGFEHGLDKIDLTALDGNLSTAAREGFRFINGQAFSGSAGEIRSFSWGGNNFNLVEIDLTGNAEADMQIFINQTAQMYASDFLI